MINWWSVVKNAIWIFGAALALVVFSLGYYQSQIENIKLKIVLGKPGYELGLNIAGAVFCVGMALTADVWWEIVLWGLLVGMFGFQLFQLNIED